MEIKVKVISKNGYQLQDITEERANMLIRAGRAKIISFKPLTIKMRFR